ncbi:E3 ubiquitin-protein ligase TRIM38-like isoform X2 [Toxotes jaculatrix]|uniref:E3 ubiquitin-protein ligase TRIM38-like isoform X2 n=1 Tax=Toxotes jaculatrix TaxID=941984 RepID=UPI001B3A894B|nr:E3 ubiquitin-protein ligase TRIM38-like isoform X2 [Toxotes jaculatrix]
MASANSFLSEDQFLCSICLDIFSEPVSIPCGHNFCKACITRHWEGKDRCQCPLCNEKFNKGLKLRVNTGFKEVVENFRKHCIVANNDVPVKPGQVPCDCCSGNKFKASKTCLVCLASFCETHLEAHQRVAALKRHKLTDPVQNLEDKICKKHNRMLELFCRKDLTRVCVLCTEHSDHDTVALEEAYVDKKAQMRKKKAEAQETKQKNRKKAQKTKRKGKDETTANSVVSNQMQAPHIWWFPYEFYYEVQAEGRTGWDLGVVRESMRGKRTFTPNPRNGKWMIRLGSNNICKALHNYPVHLCLLRKPERVLVFVDYESGLVSFYDADTSVLIYSFTGCSFNERIFLFFSPSPTEDVSWVQRLWRKVQRKMRTQPSDTLFFFIAMVFACLIFSQQK